MGFKPTWSRALLRVRPNVPCCSKISSLFFTSHFLKDFSHTFTRGFSPYFRKPFFPIHFPIVGPGSACLFTTFTGDVSLQRAVLGWKLGFPPVRVVELSITILLGWEALLVWAHRLWSRCAEGIRWIGPYMWTNPLTSARSYQCCLRLPRLSEKLTWRKDELDECCFRSVAKYVVYAHAPHVM